jgi:hypothetical protein
VKRLILITFYIITSLSWTKPHPSIKNSETLATQQATSNSRNLIIVTIDGVRWQEVFEGASLDLINDNNYCSDKDLTQALYFDENVAIRKKKLMPFLWNYLAEHGQLYGNRNEGSKVDVANIWALSYPGYNEIFTGTTDVSIATNDKYYNTNKNIFEYLNEQEAYHNKVVAFTSWDVFPYIFNNKKEKKNFLLNASYNYDAINNDHNTNQEKINTLCKGMHHKEATRNDALTFQSAKAYLEEHKPKVLFIGLGESDEMAHHKKYDLYLQKIKQSDAMIAELWQWVQSTDGYKDNTDLLTTTDHGRGNKKDTWDEHGILIKGSKQTWMAMLGPDYLPSNKKKNTQLYQKDICVMIDSVLDSAFMETK